MAKTDKYILLVGKHIYDGNKCKQEKIHDVEKRVRQTMRQLARLLISFKQELETASDVSDIYSKENIKYLRAAIEVMCQEENKLKHGLKVILQKHYQKCWENTICSFPQGVPGRQSKSSKGLFNRV